MAARRSKIQGLAHENKGVLSTIDYSMAEALYKKGRISKVEFTEALQGGNMRRPCIFRSASIGNGVAEPDTVHRGVCPPRSL